MLRGRRAREGGAVRHHGGVTLRTLQARIAARQVVLRPDDTIGTTERQLCPVEIAAREEEVPDREEGVGVERHPRLKDPTERRDVASREEQCAGASEPIGRELFSGELEGFASEQDLSVREVEVADCEVYLGVGDVADVAVQASRPRVLPARVHPLHERERGGLRQGDVRAIAQRGCSRGVVCVDRGKGRGGGKDRAIPISPDLRSILDDYLRERRRHGLVAPEFITCLHSRAGISLSTFRRIIFRVRKASGIPFSFHSLRHSFLTQLLRNGVPIHTVSALAGHTQITTTAGYLKVFDEDKEDALKRLRY